MSLYRLDTSIRVQGSHSRAIADIVEQEWRRARPGDPVIRRHVGVDPIPATAWATAVFADDVPGQSDARFSEQSWNMRSIFPRLIDDSGRPLGKYPLTVVPLSDAAPANLSIVAGGEAYVRFTVPAGTSGSIDWASGGLPVSPLVQFTVVRTK